MLHFREKQIAGKTVNNKLVIYVIMGTQFTVRVFVKQVYDSLINMFTGI